MEKVLKEGKAALGGGRPLLWGLLWEIREGAGIWEGLFGGAAYVLEDEGIDVGIFVDDFGYRLAATMAGLRVDTDKLRGVAGVGCLQGGSILEGVGRDYAVVMVGRRYHYSGIGSAVIFNIM